MEREEMIKKLHTLPWQALHDFAITKGFEKNQLHGRDKDSIITIILTKSISDDEVEHLVNEYIYGDRVTFTLWTFDQPLDEEAFGNIKAIEGKQVHYFETSGFRNLSILSVNRLEDRIEVLYVYSKEYYYMDENGKNASVWEQHRGCVWVGTVSSYLACISKHEKMTSEIVHFIANNTNRRIRQLKPPKAAITRCVNLIAISRVVLQGTEGEKTIISRSGGLTEEQTEEMARISDGRIDTSGSYLAEIADDISATIKYNVGKGSIGIYKHLSSNVLFVWSKNAIEIILEEVERLKGRPAKEIFNELGAELKWQGFSEEKKSQMNWYLTEVLASEKEDRFDKQIPEDALSLLKDESLFMVLPRAFCAQCGTYEVPICKHCGAKLEHTNLVLKKCKCGAPIEMTCEEGHDHLKIANWYIPREKFYRMIEKNIKSIYPKFDFSYKIYVVDDILYILHDPTEWRETEVYFDQIKEFTTNPAEITDDIRRQALRLNEKCGSSCSDKSITQCLGDTSMLCLPKLFYSVLPGYRPQPHRNGEYGDVSGQVSTSERSYEMKGIIKKNSENKRTFSYDQAYQKKLCSTSRQGEEIIRQFIEQGIEDNRCRLVAIIVPQYIDNGFKGTLRYLAKLGNKKILFIELDQVCELIRMQGIAQNQKQ